MKSRVVDYFISLVKIDSESKDELAMAQRMRDDLTAMGAEVVFDNAHVKTKGNVGNLLARFSGQIDKEPLLLCSHLDTVKPGKGIKPIVKDGKIFSDGSTILGADDKSGIVEIVEAIRRLQERQIAFAPIEVLLTISEEIGLFGGKNLDYSLLKAKTGYSLDSHRIGSVVIQAPTLNKFDIKVFGKESHSGACPERGISAIQIAAEAISKLKLGRIDEETTANIGIIKGGVARNIIPNEVTLEGEVRSHNIEKLEKITGAILNIFNETAQQYQVEVKNQIYKSRVDSKVTNDFPALKIDKNEEVVKIALQAAENIGLEPKVEIGGGGSDSNIFYSHGLNIPILGTGMQDVHSLKENISISDLEKGTLWIMEIIKEYSKRGIRNIS
ncbi:MAG: M20/M25/M40 family metallo-hydrolase [Candidatus Cloacimonetes bacterium]|nr:M20/M25/M40 family metallo-hydrolase [Candidatus Cloacimonadota bacterium]MBL7085547.1 M20/M25/M40 family metallo-hydrolase [Candidatus Cloacimonadota bacterium]